MQQRSCPEALTEENISSLKSYVEGKSFKTKDINDKINDIPAGKIDSPQLLRAIVDYGTDSPSKFVDKKIGDVITLDRHMSTSKDNEGLQAAVTQAASKNKKVKEYYYIKGANEGIDVNKILGEHKYQDQNEIILKRGVKLKLVKNSTLNGKPFRILEVVK